MIVKDTTYDVEITTLVYGGDAMGRLPDGRAVFVPYALPGEKIRIKLVEDRPRFAKGKIIEILSPSPDRTAPQFPNEAECGGCHYQHMTYSAQMQAKESIVRDQFQRIAGVKNPPVKPILPSPKEWHYRNTAQFHLTHDGLLGFQETGSHEVIPITECALCEETINEVLPMIEFEGIPEGVERLALRAGAGDDLMLIFEGQSEMPPDVSVDLPLSVVHLISDDEGNTYPVVMAGDDHVVMEVLDRAFRVSAGSFFQVNTQQAENMVRYLLENLPLDPTKNLLEVYAGVGMFSAFLASKVGTLTAVESASSAVSDFAVNLDEYENVALYEGLAEEVLPALNLQPDLCLVDPPRAGLAVEALDAIVKMRPTVLAYVSCDPATLARDAKRLIAAGYRLESVQPVDMFPQTYHIESISIFRI